MALALSDNWDKVTSLWQRGIIFFDPSANPLDFLDYGSLFLIKRLLVVEHLELSELDGVFKVDCAVRL